MEDKNIKLSRQQLYEEVWSEPMYKLAVRYGLSDVGLAKICNRHHVPKPKAGYWVKLQHGHKVEKPKLSKIQNEEPIIIRQKAECIGQEDPTLLTQVYEHYDFEEQKENRIIVPEKLTEPHHVTMKLERELRRTNNIYAGIHRTWKHPKLCISSEQVPRALRIIDALAKALEARQLNIDELVIFGKQIEIEVKELLDSKLKPGAKEEMEQDSLRSGYRDYDYERAPSGRLQLSLDVSYTGEGFRRNWRDGKTRKIEDLLNDFICGMIRHAAFEREKELYWERVRRERKEEENRRAEIAQRAAEERQRKEELQEQARGWERAQLIRRYVNAAIEKAGSEDAPEEFSDWVQWARSEADRIDPLVRE